MGKCFCRTKKSVKIRVSRLVRICRGWCVWVAVGVYRLLYEFGFLCSVTGAILRHLRCILSVYERKVEEILLITIVLKIKHCIDFTIVLFNLFIEIMFHLFCIGKDL